MKGYLEVKGSTNVIQKFNKKSDGLSNVLLPSVVPGDYIYSNEECGIGSGIDTTTVLLLHMNGTQGSTNFIDSSNVGNVASEVIGAFQSTFLTKFGSSAGLFQADFNSHVLFPHSNLWNFGLYDFTIQLFVKDNGHQPYGGLISTLKDSNGGWTLYFNNTSYNLYFQIQGPNNGNDNTYCFTTDLTFVDDYVHIAVVRYQDIIKIYVGGIEKASMNMLGKTCNSGNAGLVLGRTNVDIVANHMNGWQDEVVIENGIARFTEPFTPPTREFVLSGFQQVIPASDKAASNLEIIATVEGELRTYPESLERYTGFSSKQQVGPDLYVPEGTLTIFTESTTYIVPAGVNSLRVLVVAGGGGSGGGNNGGSGAGGAGGVIEVVDYEVIPGQEIELIVGDGGAPGLYADGVNGANSVFGSLVAIGGGAGAVGFWNGNRHDGKAGGSGGGAGYWAYQPAYGGAGTANQGYNGGNNGITEGWPAGGGGGGAGGPGQSSYLISKLKALGGIGLLSDITGESIEYAKGGTAGIGAEYSPSPTPEPNTGNGGSNNYATPLGGYGASGVVIVRIN